MNWFTAALTIPRIQCPPDIDVDLAPGRSVANVTVWPIFLSNCNNSTVNYTVQLWYLDRSTCHKHVYNRTTKWRECIAQHLSGRNNSCAFYCVYKWPHEAGFVRNASTCERWVFCPISQINCMVWLPTFHWYSPTDMFCLLDKEAPVIQHCPGSISIESKDEFPEISWEAPLFRSEHFSQIYRQSPKIC